MAETEAQADTECVCTACVLCTNATEDSEPLHMKKEDSLIHISGISRLNKTDIEIDGWFRGCKKADACTVDKESIEGGTWQEVDSENDEGEGKEILNRDKSYMICTKHEGVIYFYDDGQEIKECLEEQKTAFSELAKENRSDKVQFLEPFLQVSMAEQLRTGVPWQVTPAQIAYESGWGQKEMYDEYTKKQSFNLFGIKYFGNTEDNDKYVRSWTTEYISSSELDKWEKEQKRWALNGEKLINMGVSENNKIKIKVI